MNCDDAIERLPWLLNGTLEEGERQQVREHLATCERCRTARAESRDTWRIFAEHIPAEDLVAHAWGEPTGTAPELLADHLATCAQCAAELEMVRTSRQLEEDDRVALFAPRRQATPAVPPAQSAPAARTTGSAGKWRAAALAASLAGLVAAGGWFENAGRLRATEERLAATQQERETATAPVPAGGGSPGIQVSKFFTPQSFATRSSDSQETVTLPVTVDLSSLEGFDTYEIELVDAHGKRLWKGGPLNLLDEGLSLSAGSLAPGKYTILAYGLENGRRAGEAERIELMVEAAPSTP
jgi:anti-sigma factor RsiW